MKTNHLPTMIREARKQADLFQRELAELAGLTQASVSNYESGKRTPNASTIIAIAWATKCPIPLDGKTTL